MYLTKMKQWSRRQALIEKRYIDRGPKMIEGSIIEKLIQEPSTSQQSMDNGSIFVRSLNQRGLHKVNTASLPLMD